MKSFTLIVGLFAASVVGADLTTNYVATNPDLRIIKGKLYDRTKSVLWEEYSAQVVEVGKIGLVVRTLPPGRSQPPPRAIEVLATPPGRPLEHIEREKRARELNSQNSKLLLLKNWPLANPAVGSKILFRAMPVGGTNFYGDSIQVYDFGTPYIVPIVRTNAPSKKADT